MAYIYSFEKLQVWHDARGLVKNVYILTERFPESEKYGLSMQLRRAAISVVSNIAEGSGRTSQKDQAHFYQLAFSSLVEVLNQLILANDLEYIQLKDLESVRPAIEMISNKLNALRKSRLGD